MAKEMAGSVVSEARYDIDPFPVSSFQYPLRPASTDDAWFGILHWNTPPRLTKLPAASGGVLLAPHHGDISLPHLCMMYRLPAVLRDFELGEPAVVNEGAGTKARLGKLSSVPTGRAVALGKSRWSH